MKITIESTTRIVQIATESGSAMVPCRVWEGETDSGIKVQVLVTRIAAAQSDDLSQFARELTECRAPSADVQAFPLRMII